MQLSKTEAVTEPVRGAGEFVLFFSALRIQQTELLAAVSESAEADAQQSDFSFCIAVQSKQYLQHSKNVGIEPQRFRERFRTSVGVESRITDGQRESPGRQARFAEPLACFLR